MRERVWELIDFGLNHSAPGFAERCGGKAYAAGSDSRDDSLKEAGTNRRVSQARDHPIVRRDQNPCPAH